MGLFGNWGNWFEVVPLLQHLRNLGFSLTWFRSVQLDSKRIRTVDPENSSYVNQKFSWCPESSYFIPLQFQCRFLWGMPRYSSETACSRPVHHIWTATAGGFCEGSPDKWQWRDADFGVTCVVVNKPTNVNNPTRTIWSFLVIYPCINAFFHFSVFFVSPPISTHFL